MNCILEESISTYVNKWDRKDLLWIICSSNCVAYCTQTDRSQRLILLSPTTLNLLSLWLCPLWLYQQHCLLGPSTPESCWSSNQRTMTNFLSNLPFWTSSVTLPHTQRTVKSSLIANIPIESWQRTGMRNIIVLKTPEWWVSNRWKLKQGFLLHTRNWPLQHFQINRMLTLFRDI